MQGLLLCTLIAGRFRTASNVPLALLLLAFSARLGTIPTWDFATLLEHPWLLPATTTLPFLFGPLLWWYTRERVGSSRPTLVGLHLAPFALGVVAAAAGVLLRSPGEHAALVASIFAGSPPAHLLIVNGLKVGLNAVYVVLAAVVAFGAHSRRIPAARARWVRVFVVASALSLVSYAVVTVDPAHTAGLTDGVVAPFLVVAGAMVLLVYATTVALIVTPELPGCTDTAGDRSVQIASSECRRIAELVRVELERGAYRDSGLSVLRLARRIGVHPNTVSAAVNYSFGMPFPRIVNRYRVEHFRAAAVSGDDQTVLDLAFDAGFASKSTFKRVFKQETGLTPSQYLQGRR